MTGSSINPFAGYEQHPTLGALSIADLNQDGMADIVVGGDRLSVFQSQGDGTFTPPLDLPVRHVRSVAVVDLDNDGRPDIVAANDQINVFLNTSN